MSTSTTTERASDALAGRLRRVRLGRFLEGLVRGLLSWVGISLTVWGVLVLLDALMILPVELRFPLGLFGVGVTAWAFYSYVIKALCRFYSLDRTAYELEKEHDIPRNLLINAYQLSRQELTADEAELARRTVREGRGWAKRLKAAEIWDFRALLKAVGFAALVLGAWFGALESAPRIVGNSLVRFGLPHADVPPAGRVKLNVVPGHDVNVEQGANHRVLLFVSPRRKDRARNEHLLDHRPRIVVEESSTVAASKAGSGEGVRMSPVPEERVGKLLKEVRGKEVVRTGGGDSAVKPDGAVYEYKFKNLRRSRAFRIFHDPGRTYSRSYRVKVNSIPEVTQSEFVVHPPDYTGAEQRTLSGPPASVEALPGSEVEVEVGLDVSVEELIWRDPGGEVPFSQGEDGLWKAKTSVKEAGSYQVLSRRKGSKRRQVVSEGNLLTDRDDPPHVRFVTERFNREAWPGQKLQLEIAAEDNFGVSEIALTVERAEGEDEGGEELMRWNLNGPPGKKKPESVRHTVQLDPSKFTPGEDYMFRAKATDFRKPEKQTANSRPLLIRVKELDEMPDDVSNLGALELLTRAIEQQRRALSNTRTVSNYMKAVLGKDPDKPKVTFDNHRSRMETRQTSVDRLLKKFSKKTPEKMREYADDAGQVREELVHPLAEDIRGFAGDPEPWFGSGAGNAAEGTYEDEGDGWHQVEVDSRKARYAGLRMKEHHGKLAISDFEFIDGEGSPIPPPYVNRFHVSPVFKKWDGPVRFVDTGKEELESITSKALKTDLKGGGGPVVRLDGIVEDAPKRGVALYAARVIHTDQPRKVLLYAGSSDSLRIWVNGDLKMRKLSRRKPRPNSDRTEVRLKKGKNVVLAEVSANKRPPALAMRFTGADGTKLSLTENGRLVEAPEKEVIHAGGSPEHAGRAIDGDSGSNWKVKKNHPVLLIVDVGHTRDLSGVRLRVPGNTSNKKWGVGTYDLFLSQKLKIGKHLPSAVTSIEKRQAKAVDRLVGIRTAWLEHDQGNNKQIARGKQKNSGKTDGDAGPAVASERKAQELVAELLGESKRSLDLSKKRKNVLNQSGEDFSGKTMKKLKNIKDAEKKAARKMRELVQDMSQIGDLDISNATQKSNFQQMRERAKELAGLNEDIAKKDITQITDNLDTAAQELHEELEKQSEVSFGDTSKVQDVQEIAEDKKTPLPMAELPETLNDLVGKMKKGLQEFDEQAQTKGSMLKSLDADGPIGPGRMSSTSAEGKTGAQPPDAARELEGRSGFGRTGRASGEGVANVAQDIPQDKMAPPNRNTGTSLEKGGVEDRSTEAKSGGTGLGKKTNRTGQFGNEGNLPDQILDQMRQTARKTKKLRENVSGVMMQLQRHNLSTKSLQDAVQSMKRVEKAAKEGNFVQFKKSYNNAMNTLSESEEAVGQKVGKRLIRKRPNLENANPRSERESSVPSGYSDMVSEYFRTIAEDEKE